MKNVVTQIFLLILSGLLVFSCDSIGGLTQSDVNSVTDLDTDANDTNPIITSVNPATIAYGGVDDRDLITITGQYFNTTPSLNNVHFDDQPGTIVEATETQLKVEAPAYFADSTTIRIDSYKSLEFAVYDQPFKIITPLSKPGNIDSYDLPFGMAVDGSGNLYFNYGTNKKVDKIAPDGTRTEFLEIRAKSAYDLKFGSDGCLYYTYSTYIIKTDTADGSHTTSNKFNGQSAQDLDFDQNNHLYAVFNNEIFMMELADLAHTSLYNCGADTLLSCCKYYNDALYVVASYTGGGPLVWKFGVDAANGTLTSTEELVIDFSSDPNYSDANISNMMISSDGTLYFSTTNYCLLMADASTGEIAEVYADILGAEVGYLATWGENSEIFINTTNSDNDDQTTILKVLMFEETAPYYGRQ